MDAIKILGGLLGGRKQAGGLGQQVLAEVLQRQKQNRIRESQQYAQQHAARQQASAYQRAAQQRAAQNQAAQQRAAQQQSAEQRARQTWQGGPHLESVLRDVYGRRVGGSYGRQHDHRHDYNDQQLNERSVVLIRAMINAAKSDGAIDQCEQDEIVKRLQPLSQQEVQFLQQEFRRPLNVHEFAHDVPRGMEQEVYSISLMAIDLDTQAEARYLHELAECLRIGPHQCNDIHHHYGAPVLYR